MAYVERNRHNMTELIPSNEQEYAILDVGNAKVTCQFVRAQYPAHVLFRVINVRSGSLHSTDSAYINASFRPTSAPFIVALDRWIRPDEINPVDNN